MPAISRSSATAALLVLLLSRAEAQRDTTAGSISQRRGILLWSWGRCGTGACSGFFSLAAPRFIAANLSGVSALTGDWRAVTF